MTGREAPNPERRRGGMTAPGEAADRHAAS